VTFEGSSGTLQMDQSQAFTGTIAGFTGADQLDLTDIGWGANSSLAYHANSAGTGGTLSVGDGVHVANLTLLGQYSAANFSISGDGRGGTIVNDVPALEAVADAAPPSLTAPHQA
jgi:hypothetical protein